MAKGRQGQMQLQGQPEESLGLKANVKTLNRRRKTPILASYLPYASLLLSLSRSQYEDMRIRQMGFSSRLKAHRHILTLETLKFIVEYLEDRNATQAALRSGIPETYASRQGQWLKKHPMVIAALEKDLDENDLQTLQKKVREINLRMNDCANILGLEGEL